MAGNMSYDPYHPTVENIVGIDHDIACTKFYMESCMNICEQNKQYCNYNRATNTWTINEKHLDSETHDCCDKIKESATIITNISYVIFYSDMGTSPLQEHEVKVIKIPKGAFCYTMENGDPTSWYLISNYKTGPDSVMCIRKKITKEYRLPIAFHGKLDTRVSDDDFDYATGKTEFYVEFDISEVFI